MEKILQLGNPKVNITVSEKGISFNTTTVGVESVEKLMDYCSKNNIPIARVGCTRISMEEADLLCKTFRELNG